MKTLRRLNLSALQSAVISDAEQVMLLGGNYCTGMCSCTRVGSANSKCPDTGQEVNKK